MTEKNRLSRETKFLGSGFLYNSVYDEDILRVRDFDFLEVISEDLMGSCKSGYARHVPETFKKILKEVPISLHGVSLSIGSADPLNIDYLRALKRIVKAVHPVMVSEHLVWCGVDGYSTNELLPVPYTERNLKYISERIDFVQNYLGRTMAFENSPSYINYELTDMREVDFLNALTASTGCTLLLDVNNLFINSKNNRFDPKTFLRELDFKNVVHIHLAGHQKKAGFCIDSHDDFIDDQVWKLYEFVCSLKSKINAVIEWDHKLPTYKEIISEVAKAQTIQRTARDQAAAEGNHEIDSAARRRFESTA